MRVDWNFFSKRRNTTLTDYIQSKNLKTVEEIEQAMIADNLEPPSKIKLEAALKEMSPKPKPVGSKPAKQDLKSKIVKKTRTPRKSPRSKPKTTKATKK